MPKILLALIFALLPLEVALSQNLPGCLFKNYKSALGRIELKYKTVDSDDEAKSGTGFVISSDGLLLTARHVVSIGARDAQTSLSVSVDGQTYGADVVMQDETADVALLRLARNDSLAWPTVPVNKSPDTAPGDSIVALGFPRGFEATVTPPAVVSSLNTLLDGQFRKWWQTSLDLTEGMSGGPVFDESGVVVGMSVRRHDTLEDVSYVLSTRDMGSNFLDKALDPPEDRPCRMPDLKNGLDALAAYLGMPPNAKATVEQRIQQVEQYIARIREEIQWGMNLDDRPGVGNVVTIWYSRVVSGDAKPPANDMVLTVTAVPTNPPVPLKDPDELVYSKEHIATVPGKSGKYEAFISSTLMELAANNQMPLNKFQIDLRHRKGTTVLASMTHTLINPVTP